MSKRTFIGGATAIAQEDRYTPANVEIADVFTLTLTLESLSTVAVIFTATAATVANVTAGLTAAWNANRACAALATASDQGTYVKLLAVNSGEPFNVAATTTDGGGTNTQTLTKTQPTANSGPEDLNTAGNYVEQVVPVAGDDVTLASGTVSFGLNQAAVFTGNFTVAPSFSGTIGAAGQKLKIVPSSFTFSGTGEAHIDVGAAAIPLRIIKTAQAVNNHPGLEIVGSAITTLRVESGSVGVAINAGETATITSVEAAGGTVTTGSGATITNWRQSAGNHELGAAATAVTADGGTLTTTGSGAITALTNNGATVIPNSSGTITTLNQNKGRTDFTKSHAARTVTNTNHAGGDLVLDPTIITLTNKITPVGIVRIRALAA
jgi:hypothetical protein